MSERSTEHATFVIERTYPASAERVFAAWADRPRPRRAGSGRRGPSEHELDFRGRRPRALRGGPRGARYKYDALYQDIVPDAADRLHL